MLSASMELSVLTQLIAEKTELREDASSSAAWPGLDLPSSSSEPISVPPELPHPSLRWAAQPYWLDSIYNISG